MLEMNTAFCRLITTCVSIQQRVIEPGPNKGRCWKWTPLSFASLPLAPLYNNDSWPFIWVFCFLYGLLWEAICGIGLQMYFRHGSATLLYICMKFPYFFNITYSSSSKLHDNYTEVSVLAHIQLILMPVWDRFPAKTLYVFSDPLTE